MEQNVLQSKMNIYLSTAYLAPVQYYSKLIEGNSVFIEQHENYQKQSYRNRCSVLSANGSIPLSIPVERPDSLKCSTRDIRIAEHGNWRHIHWNALISAYNSTPFFEYYRDDFQPFYEKKYNFLFDFNEELRMLISELIGIEANNINYTESYKDDFSENEIDLRDTIHPKKDWQLSDSTFETVPYYQVFGDKFGFTANLSIVDLLFNMGNESILILHECRKFFQK